MSTGWTAPGSTGTSGGDEEVPDLGAPRTQLPQGDPAPSGPRRELVQELPLFPLRPLGLGEILGAAVRIYRVRPRIVLGISALVYGIAFALLTVVTGAGMLPVAGEMQAAFEDPTAPATTSMTGGDLVLSIITWVLTAVISLLSSALVTVALTWIAMREATGEESSAAGVRALLRRRAVPAVLTAAVISIAAMLAFGLLTALGALPLIVVQEGGVLTVLPIVAGALLGLLASIWVWARTLLAIPALVVEELGVLASLRRSWALTRGHRLWRVLGIGVLLYLGYTLAVSVVSGVLSTVAGIVYVVILLASSGQAAVLAILVLTVLTMIASFLATFLLAPFLSAGFAALYADVRMRHEAWDVELTRRARETWAAGEAR